jgi:pilus assembly protein CpaF
VEGKGKITIRDLVRNTLRMRPDRIVVGEVRGAEALDMIQAMSTDHDGGLSTLHANSTQDALQRLEIMAMMAEEALPSEALRFQIASAIQLVVHTERVSGGKRKIVDVAEVAREKGELLVRSIFFYKQTGVDSEGNAVGKHLATGVVPSVVERIRERGIEVDEKIFKPTSAKAARGALAKLVPPVKE